MPNGYKILAALKSQYSSNSIKLSNYAPKVVYNQRGQTCGIYALHTVLRQYGPVKARPTRSDDNFPASSEESVRHKAKHFYGTDDGLTHLGEIFDLNNLVILANEYTKRSVDKQDISDLKDFKSKISMAINQNKLVIVPFCVKSGADGHPRTDGINAHYCVAFGYSKKDISNIFVTHWGEYFSFDSKQFYESNSKIKKFSKQDWGKPVGRDINYYSAVDSSKSGSYYKRKTTIPETNLQITLAKKIVIL